MSELVRDYLASADVEHEPGSRPGEFAVVLPGERKHRTLVSLLVGDHSLSASAFVIRKPEERSEDVFRWLLERNSRLPGIAFALDSVGDVFLVGRLPLAAVDPTSLDQLLGSLLDASDSSFNELLALGFLTAMQREWDWRISRGESTRNLDAFRHLLDRSGPPGPNPPAGADNSAG